MVKDGEIARARRGPPTITRMGEAHLPEGEVSKSGRPVPAFQPRSANRPAGLGFPGNNKQYRSVGQCGRDAAALRPEATRRRFPPGGRESRGPWCRQQSCRCHGGKRSSHRCGCGFLPGIEYSRKVRRPTADAMCRWHGGRNSFATWAMHSSFPRRMQRRPGFERKCPRRPTEKRNFANQSAERWRGP